ncbi:MAG: transposase [bacterium]|nr:transposase [bacterium]
MARREFTIRRHGGRRAGAGRKPTGSRRNMPHRPRALHDGRAPAHVTLRAVSLPVSLRNASLFPVVRAALARASGAAFRVVAFSVQRDHVHLVVEADTPPALARGVQGLAVRVAKRVNALLGRRGALWGDRYHARDLTSPRAVRNALVYVLQNRRKHGDAEGPRFDPCSSARWFPGWTHRVEAAPTAPVVTARTWLGR